MSGTILNSKTNLPLENVNIVNLNKVMGLPLVRKENLKLMPRLMTHYIFHI